MSSLTINIPDELDKELNNLKVKKEEFLLNALKEKINLQSQITYKLHLSKAIKITTRKMSN